MEILLIVLLVIAVLAVIILLQKLVDKNEKIKEISRKNQLLSIDIAFLSEMIPPGQSGPNISTLETVNYTTLISFSDRLATFYGHLYFEKENTILDLGKFLVNIKHQIMDEKRIDAIEDIIWKALSKASPKLLAAMVVNTLNGEQTEKGDTLEYLEEAGNFILSNLNNEIIPSFIEEFDILIPQLAKTFNKRKEEVIMACAVIIKNNLLE